MSNFTVPTHHPETGEVRLANWLDDHFGRHLYGVQFHGEELVWEASVCRQADPVTLFNEIASLRELVKELREALHARVDGEGGTAAERAQIAKADKALGDE